MRGIGPEAQLRVSEADMAQLAAHLAPFLHKGDCLALEGDLGTGKTTFARALIRALLGPHAPDDIPSPSFALLQTYDGPRFPIFHFDFYRISDPEEARELGWDEALASGLVLAEWPERLASELPPDRLHMRISETETPNERLVTFVGLGRWRDRLARLQAIETFLHAQGWGEARRAHLQGDASHRAYVRLTRGDETALLMDAPPQPDGPPIYDGRSYSQVAHLAEDVGPFVAISQYLRAAGFSTPEIYAVDQHHGLVLLEDLGDQLFGVLIKQRSDDAVTELYDAAISVLVALRRVPPIAGLPAYDREALEIELSLLGDWFWPLVFGSPMSHTVKDAFFGLWEELITVLLAGETDKWVLRDFHSPNLLWLPERQGVARVGLIDFQDALRGHGAYDLVSLLQDARLDVPPTREAWGLTTYCRAAAAVDPDFAEEAFRRDYAFLGAHRASKVLGIFARLAQRDGKRGYLAHMPRVLDYLRRNLAHPDLASLRHWYDTHLFSQPRLTDAAFWDQMR